MKLKNKKICVNKKVVVVSILALFILVLCGISYAYFTAVITGNDTAKATKAQTGTMSLKLDGTIRLILEESINYVNYQNIDYNQSTVKQAVNDWYDMYLFKYEAKIATGSFCSDTSIYKTENSIDYYGAYGRLIDAKNPTLKCPRTTQSFGGLYKIKAGILSADEVSMAGWTYGQDTNYKNYLFSTPGYTMTPVNSNDNFILEQTGSTDMYFGNVINLEFEYFVQPVINLNADVTITSGDGTKDKPYIVG